MNPLNNATPSPEVAVYQTGQNAVTAGGDYGGWVSGDIANLAPATTQIVCFDLGPYWRRIIAAAIVFNPTAASSGLNATSVYGGDTAGVVTTARRLKDVASPGASTTFLTINTSSGPQEIIVRPMGRYINISTTNADATNAMGASATITLAAYPF